MAEVYIAEIKGDNNLLIYFTKIYTFALNWSCEGRVQIFSVFRDREIEGNDGTIIIV
jgi:hypothetical protein